MEPTSIVNTEDIRAVLHTDLSGVNLGVIDRLRDAITNEPGSASAALGSIHGADDHDDYEPICSDFDCPDPNNGQHTKDCPQSSDRRPTAVGNYGGRG
jgi:hypothetical protein